MSIHDKTLVYRGSGSDLATDIRAMLPREELDRLLKELRPTPPESKGLDLEAVIAMCDGMGAAAEPKMPHFWHQEQYRTLAMMLRRLRAGAEGGGDHG